MYGRVSKLSHVTFGGIPNMRVMVMTAVPVKDRAVHPDIIASFTTLSNLCSLSSHRALGVMLLETVPYMFDGQYWKKIHWAAIDLPVSMIVSHTSSKNAGC